MTIRITTLVLLEKGVVTDVYHSLEDKLNKAYGCILRNYNEEQGTDFKVFDDLISYYQDCEDLDFDLTVQELTSTGFATSIIK